MVQTPGSGISILLAVGTPSTGSGNLYCQWELSPVSGNALCILFPTPPSPVLSPAPPHSPIRSLDYRAAMIRLRDEAASTSYSPPLQLPSASRREDRPEVTLPPRKRLDIALGPRYEVGERSSAAAARPARGFRADYGFVAIVDREIMRDPEREVGYGITDSWDEIVETLQGAPVSTDTELGGYVREFETRVRQDTDEIYTRLDDEQTERHLLAGRLNMLFRDRLQTPGSGISILLAVETPSTGSGNLYCQWELSPSSGNALCILFPTISSFKSIINQNY
nr:hypothetical protein [Tanacetum cinerariifolium]